MTVLCVLGFSLSRKTNYEREENTSDGILLLGFDSVAEVMKQREMWLWSITNTCKVISKNAFFCVVAHGLAVFFPLQPCQKLTIRYILACLLIFPLVLKT